MDKSLNNISNSKIYVNSSTFEVHPQLTTTLGKDTIIGREKELQEIDEQLNNSNSLLLINGIGGIGKSTIASYYLHSQKEKLDYYGFFEGLESFIVELKPRLKLKSTNEDELFLEALSNLSALEGNKLLVFDDIKNIEANQDKIEKILALKESGYKILLTSREEIEEVEQYYLDVLTLNDAKELFNSIYLVEDEAVLEEILDYLDCHAFFVEMTAKTLKSKRTLTAEIVRDKFKSGEFSTIKKNRKESFNDYLNKLFSFDRLDDEEILMLKQLSVLPSHEISFDNLQLILAKDTDTEFEDLLNYLSMKGWIQKIDNYYKLHQIIKEYIFFKHSPHFIDIEQIVDFFSKLLSNSSSQVVLFMQYNISFLDSLLKIFLTFKYEDKFNEKIIDFLNPLAHTYQKVSRLDEARKTYELAVNISERIVETNSKVRVFTYGNISNFYLLIEKYELALIFLDKGFREATRIYGTEDINKILSFYMTKANILMKYKGCEEAIPIYEKIINIRVKYYGEEHLSVGEAFNNLGVCFSKEKIYDKAKICFTKSLQIYIDFYKSKHPDMISITMNLAEALMFQDNKQEALKWYGNALDMSLAYWGENHLDTALVYYNFSKYYFKYRKYEEAKKCILKSIKIQRLFLNSNHSQLLNSLDGLKRIENKLNIHSVKVGRNSPCSCKSGKKYKKCCGRNK